MPIVKINESFVLRWSERYLQEMSDREAALEERLFTVVSEACRKRGYLTRSDLRDIGHWKSPRAQHRLAGNDARTTRELSAMAFDPQATERASLLTALAGVGEPMASAILAVWDPQDYTVFDWRARATLEDAGILPPVTRRVPYGLYLARCRHLAHGLDIPGASPSKLRLLDRALWTYNQHKLKWNDV